MLAEAGCALRLDREKLLEPELNGTLDSCVDTSILNGRTIPGTDRGRLSRGWMLVQWLVTFSDRPGGSSLLKPSDQRTEAAAAGLKVTHLPTNSYVNDFFQELAHLMDAFFTYPGKLSTLTHEKGILNPKGKNRRVQENLLLIILFKVSSACLSSLVGRAILPVHRNRMVI
jgi:hypothetical protein